MANPGDEWAAGEVPEEPAATTEMATDEFIETEFGICPDCDCDMDLYKRGTTWVALCCVCEREETAERVGALHERVMR